MKCRLCEKNVLRLENSHIIPEWMYKEIYDEKNRFISIAEDNYKRVKPEQKGYREKLLCQECEVKLSKWENVLKKDFTDIARGQSSFLSIERLDSKYIFVKNINSSSFKKGLLSILWRMSITTVQTFKGYDLGLYEEKIKAVLMDNIQLGTFDFPLRVTKIVLNGEYCPDLLMCIDKGRIHQKYTLQSFIVYGFLIEVVVSKIKFPKRYEALLLSEDGAVPVGEIDFMKVSQEEGLLKRFADSDVVSFYDK